MGAQRLLITVDPKRVLSGLCLCLDFVRNGLHTHHQRVAHIGLNIAEEMGLPDEQKCLIEFAALVHDVGISTWKSKEELFKFEVQDTWEHCHAGYEMLKEVRFLRPVSDIVLSHHDRFEGGNWSGLSKESIPLPARVIHLADRIDALLICDQHVLLQVDQIVKIVENLSGRYFDPLVVTAFRRLACRESFWLELNDPLYRDSEGSVCTFSDVCLNDVDMRQMAEMFATVIDKKSRFTHNHSRNVMGVASTLARAIGFTDDEIVLIEFAALMHDLGKLSVPDEILDKPDPLTSEERAIVRQHPFYTYNILRKSGVETPIPEWAAYHHEKLDGNGYPFHLDASRLTTGSRIMAVADVFAALREDRPYRPGMGKSQVEKSMAEMVASSALDGQIVGLLFDIYHALGKAMVS